MRLTELELTNFGRHRHLRVQPGSGVTGILGANGSGKSTVLHALRLALCGASGCEGRKVDDARLGSQTSDASLVRAAFLHEGVTYDVIRGIRGVASSITVDAATTVTGEGAIARVLADAFGMEAATLAEHLFIPQGRLCEALDATPAERARLFGRLYGLDRAEAAYQACGEELAAITLPDHEAAALDCAQRLRAAEEAVTALTEEIAEIAVPAEPDDEDQQLARVLAEAAARDREVQARARAEAAVVKAREEFEAAVIAIDAAEAGLEALGDPDPLWEEAPGALSAWTSYEATVRTRERTRWESKRLDAELAAVRARIDAGAWIVDPLPVDDPDVLDPSPLAARLKQARAAEQSLRVARTCPTCGQAWSDAARLDQLVREIAALAERAALVKASRAHHERQALMNREQELTIAREELGAEVIELPPEPSLPKAEAQARVTASEAYAKTRRRLDKALTDAEARAATAEALLDQAEAGAQALGPPVAPVDVSGARAVAAERAASRRTRAVLEGRLQAAQDQVATLRAEAAEKAAEAAQGAHLRAFVERVRAARAHLHRDAAPRDLLEARLALDLESANAVLEGADSPFSVRVDSGLDLVVRFRGGIEMPAGRLSGGQKAKLALAVRLAAGAGRVGLLCADEPTYGMDRSSVRSTMTSALSHLRMSTTGVELQCIMVTHEEVVADLFDSVIRMGEVCENDDPAGSDPGPRRPRRRIQRPT